MKHTLLLLFVLLITPFADAQAQKAKRLRGQALIDSMTTAFKIKSEQRMAGFKQRMF
ncbi:hypothetical protein [Hymenobacter lapidarius]|uniref:hypothetical protein n=1 Tax=Hymenobacter lapidarius TaxID=1908237 RepID=UPI001300DC1C|nr:hypothetical protein [Hymenobacter lapidarius]